MFFSALTALTALMSFEETRKMAEVGIALDTTARRLSRLLIKHLQKRKQRSHGYLMPFLSGRFVRIADLGGKPRGRQLVAIMGTLPVAISHRRTATSQ